MITFARWVLPCFVLLSGLRSAPAEKAPLPGPTASTLRVFLLDAQHLEASRQRLRNGDKRLAPALERLEADAQKALTTGPFSVVHKNATPPSGDKHDYMSQAPYFWPNTTNVNRLPYIRRDGERNPEINKFSDHRSLDDMVEAVETLALGWYFKENEACAASAARLLRAWFLNQTTRMNPHLQYAQAIPGVNSGRGIGLIESRGLTRVGDAIGLLVGSKAWTAEDQRGLEQWFDEFLQWMLASQNGRDEAAANNNHGTYYDLQAASFALFVGKKELATAILQAAREKRIARQIEPDGRQPLELARTKAWSYSIGNLQGLMSLARLGENVGVDLWHYQTADGRGLRKALDYLAPFAAGEQKWPHQQLGGFSPQAIASLLRRAAVKYPDPRHRTLLQKMPALAPEDRLNLLVPELAKQGEIRAVRAAKPSESE